MNTFLSYVTVPASVFTLLAITIDRRKVCPMRQDLFDGVGGGRRKGVVRDEEVMKRLVKEIIPYAGFRIRIRCF